MPRVDHHPVGGPAPAERPVVVEPVDQLAGEADLDPSLAVRMDELAAVDPQSRFAVELRRALLDLGELAQPRPQRLSAGSALASIPEASPRGIGLVCF
jgi:hypothetical protein